MMYLLILKRSTHKKPLQQLNDILLLPQSKADENACISLVKDSVRYQTSVKQFFVGRQKDRDWVSIWVIISRFSGDAAVNVTM